MHTDTHMYLYVCMYMYQHVYVQPIADGLVQNLEIISKTFQRTTILPIGFMISTT